VLVAYRQRSVEVWSRGEGRDWTRAIARDGDVAHLLAGASLDVRELYEAAAESVT
jgi:hypothetical protein